MPVCPPGLHAQVETSPRRVYDMIADKPWSSVTYVLGQQNGVPHLFTFPLGGYTGEARGSFRLHSCSTTGLYQSMPGSRRQMA